MKNWTKVVLVLALAVSPALARRMAPPPVAVRAATADAIFVGKVMDVAARTVEAGLEKGDTRQMKLATVTVASGLLGRPGKNIEVGFFGPMGRMPGITLSRGEEVLFFVRKHPTRKNTYVAELYFSTISAKDNPSFKGELAEAKKAAAILADPMKALKSKDETERGHAAILLITRYKTPSGSAKAEAVPAEETKLILEALAGADWKGGGFMMTPQSVFYRLGARDKDGWTAPKDFTRFADEARKWLKDNAGKFKMTRFARPAEGPGEEPPAK